jgi:hypothetical protein
MGDAERRRELERETQRIVTFFERVAAEPLQDGKVRIARDLFQFMTEHTLSLESSRSLRAQVKLKISEFFNTLNGTENWTIMEPAVNGLCGKIAEIEGIPYVDVPGCPRHVSSIPSLNLLTSNSPLKETYYDVINAEEVAPGTAGYTFFILDKNGFALDDDSLNHYLRDDTNVFYKCKPGTPLTSLRIRQGDVHMETPLRVLNFDTRIYVMDSMAQLIQHGHTYILKPTEERIGQIASRDVVNGGSVVGGDHCQENKTERIYAIEEVAVGHPVANVGNTEPLLNLRVEPVEPRKPASAIPNSLLRNAALSNVLDEAYNEYMRNQARGGTRRKRRGTKKRSTRRRRSRRI